MQVYKSKYSRLPGSTYNEIVAAARREYHTIQKRNPRRIAHVRSAYFAKDKVFLNTFWDHVKQKHPTDQERRLKLYAAAIDLIRNSKLTPDTIFAENDKDTLLHRFYGVSQDGQYFSVQIKRANVPTGKSLCRYSHQKGLETKKLSAGWLKNHMPRVYQSYKITGKLKRPPADVA